MWMCFHFHAACSFVTHPEMFGKLSIGFVPFLCDSLQQQRAHLSHIGRLCCRVSSYALCFSYRPAHRAESHSFPSQKLVQKVERSRTAVRRSPRTALRYQLSALVLASTSPGVPTRGDVLSGQLLSSEGNSSSVTSPHTF